MRAVWIWPWAAFASRRLLRPQPSELSILGLQYAGELIAAFIERAGGSVRGKISTGAVPEGLEPVYVHRQSRPLSQIVAALLLASNNYIANQVFLEIGGHRLGGPVSLEKSLQVANEMLVKHGLAEAIQLEEGSASAATTASPRAGSPKCSSSSRPMPSCSAAATAPSSKPAPFSASAPWRAMPTPPSTGECAS